LFTLRRVQININLNPLFYFILFKEEAKEEEEHKMTMLGIKGDENAQTLFNAMKLNHQIAYMIFHIKKPKGGAESIIVDVVAYKGAKGLIEGDLTYTQKTVESEDYREAFITDVKSSGIPRFAVIDWNHKLLFISWVPDTSKAVHKMKYASVKEAFVQELVGIQIKVHATDDSELNVDIIAARCKTTV
jgi:hypothetical protein